MKWWNGADTKCCSDEQVAQKIQTSRGWIVKF